MYNSQKPRSLLRLWTVFPKGAGNTKPDRWHAIADSQRGQNEQDQGQRLPSSELHRHGYPNCEMNRIHCDEQLKLWAHKSLSDGSYSLSTFAKELSQRDLSIAVRILFLEAFHFGT